MGEEEDGDLFVRLAAEINSAMNSITWLIPVDLPGRDFNMLFGMPVTKFDTENLTLKDYRHTMKRITVPPCSLTMCENQSPHYRRLTVMKDFLDHPTAPGNHSHKKPRPTAKPHIDRV
jgi:hypothetical protein